MDIETQLLWMGRLVLAALLGVVLGWEREARGRDAGVRTFGAVSLGACLFAIISFAVVPEGRETTRVAAQVVTGVGFLGAGVILRGEGHISGLTTSATLWAAAAVGMAVGFGLYLLGTAATGLLLFLLLLRRHPRYNTELPPGEAAHEDAPQDDDNPFA